MYALAGVQHRPGLSVSNPSGGRFRPLEVEHVPSWGTCSSLVKDVYVPCSFVTGNLQVRTVKSLPEGMHVPHEGEG